MIQRLSPKKKEGFPHEKLYVIPRGVLKEVCSNPVLRGFSVTDAGHFPNARNHFRQREYGSSENIFILCVSGSGFVRIEEREFAIEADQVITIPSGVGHSYGAGLNNPWSIFWFHFVGDFVPIYVPHSLSGSVVNITDEYRQTVINLFDIIYNSLSGGTSGSYMMTAGSAAALILSTIYRDDKDALGVVSGPGARNVEDLIAYIQDHLHEVITLENLSRRSCYSVSRITQLFREFTGHPPIEFVQHQRIQRACYYLDATQDPVGWISEYVGFSDQFYFSRIFRKIVGVSPRDYRQRHSE